MKNMKFIAGIIVFGSLWGFAECIIGSLLRDVNLPAGAIMTGIFAIGLMTLSRTTFRQPGMQVGIGLVAGALRLFNPFGGCFICSAIAIMAEGLLFDLIWTGFSLDLKKPQTLTIQASLGICSAYLGLCWRVYRNTDPDTGVFLRRILPRKPYRLHPTDPCQRTACSTPWSGYRSCSIYPEKI